VKKSLSALEKIFQVKIIILLPIFLILSDAHFILFEGGFINIYKDIVDVD